MPIYTKTGDDGTTGLFGSGRVPKNHPRVVAYGDVDELNSFVGLARAAVRQSATTAALDPVLERIQHRLHTMCAEIATPQQSANYAKVPKLTEADVTFLEAAIDRLTKDLPELTHFILPDGNSPASTLHICRTVARRAERSIAAAVQHPDIILDPLIGKYLNRLSDLLFTMARWTNIQEHTPEIPWMK